MFNAHVESVDTTFKDAFRSARCLIPATARNSIEEREKIRRAALIVGTSQEKAGDVDLFILIFVQFFPFG
jgi:hypothetical protein